ncbi:response regulator [Streptomyces sp. NPDC060184]|uniref:response regulator n=1 Tax=Streptomyces sp. NPDC060184 TaxID=3347064 RepID=UPI003665348B
MPDDMSRAQGSHTPKRRGETDHTAPVRSGPNTSQHPAGHRSATTEVESPFPPLPAAPPPAVLRVVVADDNPVVRAGLGALLSGRPDIEVVAEATDGRQAYEMVLSERPDVLLLDVRMPGVDGISALPYLVPIAPVLMLTYSRESEIVREALRLGAGGYLVHGEFTADQLVAAVRDTKDGRASFTATAANALLAHVRQGASSQRPPLPDGLGAVPASGPLPKAEGERKGPPGAGRELPVMLPQSKRTEGVSQLQPPVGQFSGDEKLPKPGNRSEHGLSSREVEIMELIASGMSNQQIAAVCFISEKTVKNHINRIFTKLRSRSRSEAIARWLGTAPSASSGPQWEPRS